MSIKILILGLREAGKTTLVKHILEGKEFHELQNLPPTEGIETQSYKYRGLLEVNIFDCGGQTQFLEHYYHESMVGTVFGGKIKILFWVIDSSDEALLKDSRKEFIKALKAVRTYSDVHTQVYVLVHKYDKHVLQKKDIESYFKEVEDIKGVYFYTTSCVSGSARNVVARLLDAVVLKESEARINSLQKILKQFNSRIKAKLSSLINSDDGLEIASEFSEALALTQNKEVLDFLQYLSVKVIVNSFYDLQKIFNGFKEHKFITNSEFDLIVWRFKEEYILFFKLHPKVCLLTVLPLETISLDKCTRELEKIIGSILEILKL